MSRKVAFVSSILAVLLASPLFAQSLAGTVQQGMRARMDWGQLAGKLFRITLLQGQLYGVLTLCGDGSRARRILAFHNSLLDEIRLRDATARLAIHVQHHFENHSLRGARRVVEAAPGAEIRRACAGIAAKVDAEVLQTVETTLNQFGDAIRTVADPRRSGNAQTHIPPKPTPRAQYFMDLASTRQRTSEFLSGYTRITYDERHGTQVEYNASDGRSFLWYPGSMWITAGSWKAVESLAPDEIHRPVRVCFLYPTNSVDPSDGSRGGAWSCVPGWYALMRTTDRMKGDVFNLSVSGHAPFVLSPSETTIAKLLKPQ